MLWKEIGAEERIQPSPLPQRPGLSACRSPRGSRIFSSPSPRHLPGVSPLAPCTSAVPDREAPGSAAAVNPQSSLTRFSQSCLFFFCCCCCCRQARAPRERSNASCWHAGCPSWRGLFTGSCSNLLGLKEKFNSGLPDFLSAQLAPWQEFCMHAAEKPGLL